MQITKDLIIITYPGVLIFYPYIPNLYLVALARLIKKGMAGYTSVHLKEDWQHSVSAYPGPITKINLTSLLFKSYI